jgi:hypothetical protein
MEYFNEEGKLHREDGPAIINGDRKEWYIHGELHRENGPALIDNGKIGWYQNNKLHCLDGPALIDSNYKIWCVNGLMHREDGPAYICGDYEEWYINDIRKEEEWVEKYLKIKNKHILLGVIVSNYWKIREIILRWRYNPALKCVQLKIKREFDLLY